MNGIIRPCKRHSWLFSIRAEMLGTSFRSRNNGSKSRKLGFEFPTCASFGWMIDPSTRHAYMAGRTGYIEVQSGAFEVPGTPI